MDYRLIHGDCLEVLPTLEAGSVDAVITDPPYGTTACKWDSVIPFDPMWAGIKHVIKRNAAVVLFGIQPFTSALVMSNPKWFRYEWVWDKGTTTNFQLANVGPLREHETISVFGEGIEYKPQMSLKEKPTDKRTWALESKRGDALRHFNSKSSDARRRIVTHSFPRTILHFNAVAAECNGQHRLHPTQKPVALLEYLIRTYTNEGETVLDFTMGSGSTGVACLNTGRRFIGIEKDAAYFAIAEQRLAQAAQQTRLAV